ncbi:50S ribosomal protein P1 [Candidatus Woesearchaeota archaeon]|nr:50S ribosomal protein P1 [Candidatus Woesearchaeota archaeon]
MEYIYASMLLHKAGKEINEANVKKVIEATGLKADDGRIKALVAALKDVNIEEAIKASAIPAATAPIASAPAGGESPVQAKKEEAKEEKKDDSAAVAGLGSLFG